MTKPLLKKRLDTLRGIEKKMNEKYHADTVKLNIQHSYSNMLEVIEKNEYVVAIAKKQSKTLVWNRSPAQSAVVQTAPD